MSGHRDATVWGADGEGNWGVSVQRTLHGRFAVGIMERRKPNRAERRGGRDSTVVTAHEGAGLTRADLTRLRATIDEELQEETHDGQETA